MHYIGMDCHIKTISPTELVKSVIDMANKGVAIHPTVMPQIREMLSVIPSEKSEAQVQLSAREREVIELVAAGRTNHDIAKTLLISENTVKGHLRRITDKIKVNNGVEVARYALLNGLASMASEDSLGLYRAMV